MAVFLPSLKTKRVKFWAHFKTEVPYHVLMPKTKINRLHMRLFILMGVVWLASLRLMYWLSGEQFPPGLVSGCAPSAIVSSPLRTAAVNLLGVRTVLSSEAPSALRAYGSGCSCRIEWPGKRACAHQIFIWVPVPWTKFCTSQGFHARYSANSWCTAVSFSDISLSHPAK